MAPTKKTASKTTEESTVLHELVSIRNSLQLSQQAISRLDKKFQVAPVVEN